MAGRLALSTLLTAALTFHTAYGQLFDRVTTGALIQHTGVSVGISWGDYDGDGHLDFVLVHQSGTPNALFHNDRDGTFTRVTTGPVVTDHQNSGGSCWADYDNDGDLDLFVTNIGGHDFLYRNNGNGSFATALRTAVASHLDRDCAWGDYDNDGFVDLFLSVRFGSNNALYHNEGDGTLSRVLTGPVVNDGKDASGGSWADYDNDGDLDLFVANASHQNNALYENVGGSFVEITSGPVVSDGAYSAGGSWADLDNDGDLDLMVTNGSANDGLSVRNLLYLNDGHGNFTQVTSGPVVADARISLAGSWGDYDNDGDVDLFVSNAYRQNDDLFRNDGGGAFTRIGSEPMSNDGAYSLGAAWADYDNDGDLDLYAVNRNGPNLVYNNRGNDNHWINLRLVGTVSNASAIGAKVIATATIGGELVTQLQEVSSKTARASQNSLNVEFGLGDATVVERLRIEWPSGLVQLLRNVAANQFLTIVEGEDTTPPVIAVREAPLVLSPPNHKYREIRVSDFVTSVSDDTDGSLAVSEVVISHITSDEPENGKGDGNTLRDMVVAADCGSAGLRAERSGNGNGRVYTIHFAATDAAGNVGSAQARVLVPKGSGRKAKAVEDGVAFVVHGSCMAAEPMLASSNLEQQAIEMFAAEEASVETGLGGNYPNPFNPSTEISYTLAEAAHVRLFVYDMLGREVQRLVDGPAEEGRHVARFDATDLPSGTYVYRLWTEGYSETRTMLLLK